MVFEWLVIGGGPTGTCAVAALLQRSFEKTGWIERESFKTMGRLSLYGSVPANTRNDRLVTCFCSLEALAFEECQRKRSEEERLLSQPQMETARLQLSLDALRDGSEHMRKKYTDRLWWKECLSVTKLSCNGNIWRIQTRIGEVLEARRVILATGGEPRVPDELLRRRLEEANIRLLHHDDVVVPARLEDPPQFRKLGVVGGAHSGMLAAMNFLSLKPSASVCVFDRKPKPRFAEERDGWIKYDGTGLKGSVASWTKKMLESHDPCLSFEQISPSDDPIKKLKERKVDAVVFTVGFDKTNQIDVSFQDKTVDLSPSQPHDGRTGRLAPGLHGVGIAFPEYWTDEEAFTEPRVGFVVHFVKHLDRVFRAAIDETL